jgi:perosamine synthetase
MSEIPLSSPDITDAEIDAVADVLRSGRLSIGPKQDLFEQLVAERCERAHGVACSSGTAGLHMVLEALGVGPGDEVLTTPFSFIASSNCALMVGAKPVFADICPQSMNLDPAHLEAAITEKTKAIVAVEVFGNPRHMAEIESIARRHELPLIEDACEGLGGKSTGRPIGGFGRAAVFGFYPNKQITTGEGGMIVTDDDRLANHCKSLRNQGRAVASDNDDRAGNNTTGSWLAHQRLGYNYRLSEINAALGCVQMDRLDELLHKRRRVANAYTQRLLDHRDLMLPGMGDREPETSWFVYVVRLAPEYDRAARDRIIAGLRRHDIGCSNYFPPIHLQPFYKERFGFQPGDFPITESISDRTIALPFYNDLDETQIDLVCHTLSVMLQRERLLLDDSP